jgi:hypothetical protein
MQANASQLTNWQCPSCKRVHAQNEFCSGCGARIGIFCPNCHTLTAIADRFCQNCGQDKEKVYRQQQTTAANQVRDQIATHRQTIRDCRADLTLPAILLKGSFARGFFCSRALGGFLLLFAAVTYFLTQSFQETMRPTVIAEAQTQFQISLWLGIAFFTIPAAIGFAREKRHLLSTSETSLSTLEGRLDEIERIGFIDWCIRTHQSWTVNYRIKADRRQDNLEHRDDNHDSSSNDEYWKDYFKQQDREFEDREKEKAEQRRADEEYWERREEEERKQREEDDYYREMEEKRQREENDE